MLVHCFEGKSRSAAVVAHYLMRGRKMRLHEAMAMITAARSIAKPNAGFMRQLEAADRQIAAQGH